ncbi:hypothetical protein Q0F99_11495 [Rathayibacter oskolensis]|uniref:hypothetical protein n=1 Tax=Rathayibacter TaxID=33886 RepID=UPI001316B759|nr:MULTISPECIES: hypothetical protein [Rathayibacter]QHC65663.1 hypothetical protein GSU68_03090 [Rathayibacter sp. VKM Ac-2759]WKK70489.1 hypothetical protein Q0F99_11495 [Rathayibacter oskolensis]
MSSFVLLYLGGTAPESPADRAASEEAWGAWFARVGDALTDPGSPFAGSFSTGADHAPSGVTGYSIVQAADSSAVEHLLDGHPHLLSGGTIEAHETVPM